MSSIKTRAGTGLSNVDDTYHQPTIVSDLVDLMVNPTQPSLILDPTSLSTSLIDLSQPGTTIPPNHGTGFDSRITGYQSQSPKPTQSSPSSHAEDTGLSASAVFVALLSLAVMVFLGKKTLDAMRPARQRVIDTELQDLHVDAAPVQSSFLSVVVAAARNPCQQIYQIIRELQGMAFELFRALMSFLKGFLSRYVVGHARACTFSY